MDEEQNGPDRSIFNNWVNKNYGGNTRTKTITREKYMKISKFIRGDDTDCNAKFRFWVRNKGFQLLRHNKVTNEIVDDKNGELYVSLHAKEDNVPIGEFSIEKFLRTNLPAVSFFRKIATIEEFYGIIKAAHVDEKGGHAGQKKTYRLVSDTYAFLPREVITYYLLNCEACKPRIHKYGPIPSKTRAKKKEDSLVAHNIHCRSPSPMSSAQSFPYVTMQTNKCCSDQIIRPLPRRHSSSFFKKNAGITDYTFVHRRHPMIHNHYLSSSHADVFNNNIITPALPILHNTRKRKFEDTANPYEEKNRYEPNIDTQIPHRDSNIHAKNRHFSTTFPDSRDSQIYLDSTDGLLQRSYGRTHRQRNQYIANSQTKVTPDMQYNLPPYRVEHQSPHQYYYRDEFTYASYKEEESLGSAGYDTYDSISSDSQSPSKKDKYLQSWANKNSPENNRNKKEQKNLTEDTSSIIVSCQNKETFKLNDHVEIKSESSKSLCKENYQEKSTQTNNTIPIENGLEDLFYSGLDIPNFSTLSQWHQCVYHEVLTSLSMLTDEKSTRENNMIRVPSRIRIAEALKNYSSEGDEDLFIK